MISEPQKNSKFPLYWWLNIDPYIGFSNPYIRYLSSIVTYKPFFLIAQVVTKLSLHNEPNPMTFSILGPQNLGTFSFSKYLWLESTNPRRPPGSGWDSPDPMTNGSSVAVGQDQEIEGLAKNRRNLEKAGRDSQISKSFTWLINLINLPYPTSLP